MQAQPQRLLKQSIDLAQAVKAKLRCKRQQVDPSSVRYEPQLDQTGPFRLVPLRNVLQPSAKFEPNLLQLTGDALLAPSFTAVQLC